MNGVHLSPEILKPRPLLSFFRSIQPSIDTINHQNRCGKHCQPFDHPVLRQMKQPVNIQHQNMPKIDPKTVSGNKLDPRMSVKPEVKLPAEGQQCKRAPNSVGNVIETRGIFCALHRQKHSSAHTVVHSYPRKNKQSSSRSPSVLLTGHPV